MIRRARNTDIPGLMSLSRTAHAASIFATVPVDEDAAKRAWLEAINTPAAVVFVAEKGKEIIGCMVGRAGSLYHCLGVAVVVDEFWYVLPGSPRRAGLALLRQLERWAKDTFQRFVIRITTSDAIGAANNNDRAWQRMGYRRAGAVYGKEIGI